MKDRRILIVDDEADTERTQLEVWKSSAQVKVLHPRDVTIDDLKSAHVVVVDFQLKDWQEREQIDCIAMQPMNGFALLQVLKSHERNLPRDPTAFVVRSWHLADLTSGQCPDTRLHSIARQHGLEWVLEKTTKPQQLEKQVQQLCSLADSVEALPASWPTDNPHSVANLFKEWLKLKNDTSWMSLAWQDIEDCHPPIHELNSHRDGMRLVRWMTQRILPYPCFLMNESRLAVRLKVTLESLREGLKSGLKDLLISAEYTGALHKFMGGRFWWQSGLESVLWELCDGRSFDTEFVFGLLNDRCDCQLKRLEAIEQPVLCLNEKLGWLPEPIDISQAVRIQPDDWPAFAEQAWARLADARIHPQLAAAVIAADRDRLNPSVGE